VAKKQVELIYPTNLVKEPLIHQMSKTLDVVFNIRRAKVTPTTGEIVLELEAKDEKTLEAAVQFLTKKGVSVQPVTHSALES
jgi:ABC-type methionine transport system ATPase subunit